MNEQFKNQLHTIIEKAVRDALDAMHANVANTLNEPWIPGTPLWSDSPLVKRRAKPKARKKPGPKPGSKRKVSAKKAKSSKRKTVTSAKKPSAKKAPAVKAPRAGTQAASIIEAIRSSGSALNLSTIKAQVAGSALALNKTVQYMVRRGQIKRVRPGLYELP